MMFFRYKVLFQSLFLSSLLVSTAALAGGNSGQRILDQVILWNNGAVTISGETPWNDPDQCSGTTTTDLIGIRPPDSNQFYSEQYAAALASYLQGKNVSAYVSGCYATTGGPVVPVLLNMNIQ